MYPYYLGTNSDSDLQNYYYGQRMMWLNVIFCVFLSIYISLATGDNDTCQGRYCSAHSNSRVFEPRGESLKLVSTGMRKKNLVVAAVDVYSVGIYISSDKEKTLKKTTEKNIIIPFDIELSKPINDKASLATVLTFARNVGKSAIVDALVTALSKKGDTATYEAAVQTFKSFLTSSIGDKGIQKGEEIAFVWTGNKRTESLLVLVRGSQVGSIENKELRQKLASIYLGTDAVAPEVVTNLQSFFSR